MKEVADVRIAVRYADGHVGLARVRCLEPTGAGLSELELHLFLEGEDKQVFKSKRSLFDAFAQARLAWEPRGIRFACMGTHERVYPSPMQEDMGVNTLAYKAELGKQAMSADMVDIFAPDPEMSCATVHDQAAFRERWFASLRG